MHKIEVKKYNKLTERIKNLEKELTLKEPLAQEKEKLWANIIDFVNYILPSIHAIFEQNHLVNEATEEIQRVKAKLGNMPEQAS